MNLQSSFTYDNLGRRTSRTLQLNNTTIASAGRSYDTFGRIASVSNGTDTLSYTYRPGGQLSLAGWTNGQNVAMSNQSYEYDQYNRLTGIKLNNVNEVSYTLNAKDQRTAATYANAGLWNFTYDDKGQVTGANGGNISYAYSYDGIGNRTSATKNNAVTNYTSNLLNQYTLINSAVPNYDADGNMTTSGNGWGYTYNGENRITQATKGSTSVTMTYDYAGRRISKTVSESGVVQNAYKYVYDGFKLIAIYNNNDLVMTFTWQPESLGMDVPISMTYSGATYYYVTDGNKNVTALLDASGNRVAEYVYGPFGQTVSATGSMAQINPFRFSSEFHDDETGLVYYNYRYYSPELGRWTKRDPIEEEGGFNLYSINGNNPLASWDVNGLECWKSEISNAVSSGWNRSVHAIGEGAGAVWNGMQWVAGKTKDGVVWTGTQVYNGAVWTGTQVYNGAVWTGTQVYNGTVWTGTQVYNGATWTAEKIQDKYVLIRDGIKQYIIDNEDCGSGELRFLIPDNPFYIKFKDCCIEHDQCYKEKRGKLCCDYEFLQCMLNSSLSKWYQAPLGTGLSAVYYSAVSIFGFYPYYYK